MNTTTPPTKRDPFDGYSIGAELLHAFAKPWSPYEDWIYNHLYLSEVDKFARRWGSDWDSEPLVIVDSDGNKRFRMDYAYSLARKFPSFTGAILTIAICEIHGGGQISDENSVEAELERYQCLAAFGKASCPKLLHEYLGVDDKYQPWIQRQISKFQMRESIDYFKGKRGNNTPHGSNMIITLPRAFEIAKAQDTRRAEQIRICTEIATNVEPHKRPGFHKMTELLMAAEARSPGCFRNRKSATKSSRI
jgi:phage anti-repressor protein